MAVDVRKHELSEHTFQSRRPIPGQERVLPPLSQDQREALELILMGKSVFLTGAAGTGKTFLTRVLVEMLEAQGKSVTLTASTGVAASRGN